MKIKPPYAVANIKENGLDEDIEALVKGLSEHKSLLGGKTVILAVPHIHIKSTTILVKQYALPIFVAAQYVSRFPSGAYTGENSASMIAQHAQFTLAGHSERRKHFRETDEDVVKQTKRALETTLIPIYCASNVDQVRFLKERIPNFDGIILVEDIKNISTGLPNNLANTNQPLNPQEANRLAEGFKKIFPDIDYLYGGSVDKDNVEEFMKYFKGYVIGARSLNPSFFLSILEKTIDVQ